MSTQQALLMADTPGTDWMSIPLPGNGASYWSLGVSRNDSEYGTIMVAGADTSVNGPQFSKDGGLTWTNRPTQDGSWDSCQVSSTGQYMLAGMSNTPSPYRAYQSSDYGDTFQSVIGAVNVRGKVVASGNLQYQLQDGGATGTTWTLRTSTNSGNAWNTSTLNPVYNGYSMSIMENGMYGLAIEAGGNSGFSYWMDGAFDSWSRMDVPNALGGALHPTDQYLLFLWDANYIYRYSNGGDSGYGMSNQIPGVLRMALQNQYGVLVTSSKKVYVTVNAGMMWTYSHMEPVVPAAVAMGGTGNYAYFLTGKVLKRKKL